MKPIDTCLILGTRSWARVLLRASIAAFSPTVRIVVFEGSTSQGFVEWLKAEGLSARVSITPHVPRLEKKEAGLAIVANSAPLHSLTTRQVLQAGYHAVVEKPLSFSKEDSLSLVERAMDFRRHLFSTNIPLFAGHLDGLRAYCSAQSRLTLVQIEWMDPAFELRHGTRKNYDSATPLIFDVLPHITTILWALLGEKPLGRHSEISVAEGGARTRILFEYGDVPVAVNLARNAERRIRHIRVSSEDGDTSIDFGAEPSRMEHLTPHLATGKLPSVQMLEAVASSCLSPRQDPRLTVKTNILANELLDTLAQSYVEQQITFLGKSWKVQEMVADDAQRYARKEAQAVSTRLLKSLEHDSPVRRLFERYEEFQ